MDEQEYTISIPDIQAYLTTIGMDEPCGVATNPHSCLVANALQHKYHKPFHVNSVVFYPLEPGAKKDYYMPYEVQYVIRVFDAFGEDEFGDPIFPAVQPSRSAVERYIPELTEDYDA